MLTVIPPSIKGQADDVSAKKAASGPSTLTTKHYANYEINFENVSIIEYLKFISKIGKVNFVYDENDLNFSTTIVSEEPASLASILSALVQTLRMNGLDIIENGNTISIVKKGEPRMGVVVTDKLPLKSGELPSIITWVYKIKNANPQNIGRLIKPLLSPESILEISEATRYMVVTDTLLNVEEIKKLLFTLDSSDQPLDVQSFTSRYTEPSHLVPILTEIMNPLSKGNPLIFVPQDGRSKLFVISTPELVKQSLHILHSLDEAPVGGKGIMGPVTSKNILLYQVKHKSIQSIASTIDTIVSDLENYEKEPTGLLDAFKSMKSIPESHCVMFIGLPNHLKEIASVLEKVDLPMSKEEMDLSHASIFVYKIKHSKPEVLMNSLAKLVKKLEISPYPNTSLINTLKSAKLVRDNHTIVFDGSPESIDRVRELIQVFDNPNKNLRTASDFYIYRPLHESGGLLDAEVKSIAEGLSDSGLSDIGFIDTLLSGRWIPSASVLVFTGSEVAIEKLHTLLVSLDAPAPESESTLNQNSDATLGDNFMIYPLKYISGSLIIEQIKEVQRDLQAAHKNKKPTKEALEVSKSLASAKWLSSTNSLLIIGESKTLEQIKNLLDKFDTKTNIGAKSFFFLYEPKHVPPGILAEDVAGAARKMRAGGLEDYELLAALDGVTLVSDDSSLLFTGSEGAVTKIKAILATLDTISPSKANEFFIYSPLFVSGEFLQKEIKSLAMDMERSDFADPTLIRSLISVKLIREGDSLFFTATTHNLPKIKELLKSIDNKNFTKDATLKDQSVFLLYNTKHVSAPDLINYLKNIAEDLDTEGSEDRGLIKSIHKLRAIGDSNTLMITGTRSVVQEVKTLAEKFDTEAFVHKEVSRISSGYLLYTPRYQTGRELINLMGEFETNLRNSGFTQSGLFDVIDHLKWMPEADTIIVSGSESETKQVLSLLERFDVPTATEDHLEFMIYKVQFHSGSEILSALKQIGLDFAEDTSPSNKAFLEAVNRLQFIEVTNSLISTGTDGAIKRLKQLIKEVDVPLRQVFVEVLMIETQMSDQLDFGLRWGSQGKYREKFAYSTGANPISTSSEGDALGVFQQNLGKLNGTDTTPNGQFFPIASGFDLGVMGDIILHKGQSYFALGSLFNSLRTTNNTTIVMNQKIITQDNKNSTLFVGQNIPYTGSLVTNQAQNTLSTANLEYRDVGISLSITPTITNGDIITLAIDQEISEVVDTQSFDAGSGNSDTVLVGIQTSKNTTRTVVSVPNKSFLVISGQIDNSIDEQTTSIPCLGALPIIGAAFTDVNKTKNNDNMIIFIRPQLIQTFDEYKAITERQEELHRHDSGDAEEFDASLELLKTPDDY